MENILIKKGKVSIYRIFDAALEINLAVLEKTEKEGTKRLRFSKYPYTKAIQLANPPVSLDLQPFSRKIFGRDIKIGVIAKAYDFGVISIAFDIPIPQGTHLRELEDVSRELDQDPSIDALAMQYVTQLISSMGSAIISPDIKEDFIEDYLIFYIEELDKEMKATEFLEKYDPARLLLYESKGLSRSMRGETLRHSFSYYPDDLVIVHIDNALIIEPSGSSDLPDLLEFANAQIVELRYYDHVIDQELKRIYKELSRDAGHAFFRLRQYEALAKKITRIVTEITEVTEKVNNSLKVTEDMYYARVYRTFMTLLRSRDWETSINEKLGIVMNTYKMLHDEISAKRGYVVELSILILIAVEMVLAFL